MQKALKETGINAISQYAYGPYVLDFVIPNRRIVIECDGDYWHSLPEVKERDTRKDRYLHHHKWTVLRFTEYQINHDLANCLAVIRELLYQ